MPPAYLKPYVKRGKTDAADAEAICEAVSGRPCASVHKQSCPIHLPQQMWLLENR